MTETVAQAVRDALIVQDFNVRRVIGGQQRLIAQRQATLERKIKAAIEEIDPGGAPTELQRAARMKRLQKRVQGLTKEAYASHLSGQREALQGVAKAETLAVTGALSESV